MFTDKDVSDERSLIVKYRKDKLSEILDFLILVMNSKIINNPLINRYFSYLQEALFFLDLIKKLIYGGDISENLRVLSSSQDPKISSYSKLLTSLLDLLQCYRTGSFIGILAPIIEIYSVWANLYGNDTAKEIADDLKMLSAETDIHHSFIRTINDFFQTCQTDVMEKTILLAGFAEIVDKIFLKISKAAENGDTIQAKSEFAKLAYEMLVSSKIYTPDYDLEVKIKNIVTDKIELQQIIDSKGFQQYKSLIKLFSLLAEENHDETLKEIVSILAQFLELLDTKAQRNFKHIFIQFFAQALIKLGKKKDIPALSYAGIFCIIGYEIYPSLKNITQAKKLYSQGFIIIECIENCLEKITRLTDSSAVEWWQALVIIIDLLLTTVRNISNSSMKLLDSLHQIYLALELKLPKLRAIKTTDEKILKIQNCIIAGSKIIYSIEMGMRLYKIALGESDIRELVPESYAEIAALGLNAIKGIKTQTTSHAVISSSTLSERCVHNAQQLILIGQIFGSAIGLLDRYSGYFSIADQKRIAELNKKYNYYITPCLKKASAITSGYQTFCSFRGSSFSFFSSSLLGCVNSLFPLFLDTTPKDLTEDAALSDKIQHYLVQPGITLLSLCETGLGALNCCSQYFAGLTVGAQVIPYIKIPLVLYGTTYQIIQSYRSLHKLTGFLNTLTKKQKEGLEILEKICQSAMLKTEDMKTFLVTEQELAKQKESRVTIYKDQQQVLSVISSDLTLISSRLEQELKHQPSSTHDESVTRSLVEIKKTKLEHLQRKTEIMTLISHQDVASLQTEKKATGSSILANLSMLLDTQLEFIEKVQDRFNRRKKISQKKAQQRQTESTQIEKELAQLKREKAMLAEQNSILEKSIFEHHGYFSRRHRLPLDIKPSETHLDDKVPH